MATTRTGTYLLITEDLTRTVSLPSSLLHIPKINPLTHFTDITPRFEFGFGLSYTNFTYSNLSITGKPTAGPATGAKGPGGPADLFETVATVTAKIANTGRVAGAEVPQLYIGYPASAGEPLKQLRGFAKLKIEVGASGTATFKVRRRDMSIWDTTAKAWTVVSGSYDVYVGASSRDVRLTGKITV
jgi:beta-glucosidase